MMNRRQFLIGSGAVAMGAALVNPAGAASLPKEVREDITQVAESAGSELHAAEIESTESRLGGTARAGPRSKGVVAELVVAAALLRIGIQQVDPASDFRNDNVVFGKCPGDRPDPVGVIQ